MPAARAYRLIVEPLVRENNHIPVASEILDYLVMECVQGQDMRRPAAGHCIRAHGRRAPMNRKQDSARLGFSLETNPPSVFVQGPGPFPTDGYGTTQTLTVKPGTPDGRIYYSINHKTKREFHMLSAGGIIIDS
jgi:hypothetical protein